MHASLIIVGLSALAGQALAAAVDTIVDTTVITITSCAPEVENCPGKTSAPNTTTELTETSTYCPPTITTPVFAPTTPTTAPIVTPTYPASIPSASSVTIQLSEVPSSTITSAAPVTTPASNLSIATYPANPVPTSAPAEVSSAPVGPPVYSNSTLTAPVLPGSETGILTASGSPTPSTLTSVVVVPPTSTTGTGSASSSSGTPKATGAAGHLVTPGVMLGLLAVGAALLG